MSDPHSKSLQTELDSAWRNVLFRHALLAVTDGSGRPHHVSPALDALLGAEPRLPLPPEALESARRQEVWRGRVRLFDKGGRTLWLMATVTPIPGVSERVLLFGSDITELILAERLCQGVVADFPEAVVRLDARGRVIFANDAFGALFGRPATEMVGAAIIDLVDEADRAVALAALIKAQAPPHRAQAEVRVHGAEGTHWIAWDVFAAVRDGGEAQLYSVWRDISSEKLKEAAGAESEERYRALLENASDAIFLADLDDHVLEMNRRALDWLGYRPSDLVNLTIHDLHPPSDWGRLDAALQQMQVEGSVLLELSVLRKDGSAQPAEVSATLIEHRGRKLALGILRDLANRREAERERLYHLAFYDGLTRLPNREMFYDRLYQSLGELAGTGELLGLLFIDLDRFKHVNETLGHSVGDQLLTSVSERFRQCVRENDTLARVGGDEFTVILPRLERADDAGVVATCILDELARPFIAGGTQLFVSASIGIALSPRDGTDPESLMKNAETAMYRAKEFRYSSFKFYAPEMSARFFERLSLEQDLRRALQRDELQLVYQPQVDVRTGRLAGLEALVRWQHRQFGAVSPSIFIGLAEEVGLIDEIGEWVLRTAAVQASGWSERFGGCRVAVNLSACQLRYEGFMQRVERILKETGLAPSYLEFELTESVLMQDTDRVVSLLHGLAELGVRIAIDDFGTGYSSLAYLKRFAIHKLKIDRSFVRDIPDNSNDAALAGAIVAMAHALQLQVIAEGVETHAQYKFLRDQGCDEMQGYLLSSPLSVADVNRIGTMTVRDWRPAGA